MVWQAYPQSVPLPSGAQRKGRGRGNNADRGGMQKLAPILVDDVGT
jgi:hypothetical protein